MPELIHDCGKKIRFPSGTEGRRGKCPHCGGPVQVPGGSGVHPQHTIRLDPPADWAEYQAYLDDRGPPPRRMVMPHKLMLAAEAEEAWERQSQIRPSKFYCPSCKERINVDQVICTKCGLDFRTGYKLDRSAKLSDKGLSYLAEIPWLEDARKSMDEDDEPADKGSGSNIKAPRPRRKRLR